MGDSAGRNQFDRTVYGRSSGNSGNSGGGGNVFGGGGSGPVMGGAAQVARRLNLRPKGRSKSRSKRR